MTSRPRSLVYLTVLALATKPVWAAPERAYEGSSQRASLYYHSLAAEMALARNLPDLARQHYLEAALLYPNEAKLAEMATYLAIQTESLEAALTAALLWSDAAPQQLPAHLIALTLILESPKPIDGYQYLYRAFQADPNQLTDQVVGIYKRLPASLQTQLFHLSTRLATEQAQTIHAPFLLASLQLLRHDPQTDQTIERCIELDPKYTAAIILKARLILQTSGELTEVMQYLRKMALNDPDNRELVLFYASALQENQEWEAAIRCLKNLTRQEDQWAGLAWLNLGQIYLGQKEYFLAVTTLQRAMQFANTRPAAEFLLAQAFEVQGNLEQAIRYYTHIEEGPFHTKAYLRAADLLTQTKAFDKAIDVLQASQPQNLEDQKHVILAESDLLIHLNRLEEANSLIDNALFYYPQDIEYLYAKGIISMQQARYPQAEKSFKLLLSVQPEHAEALNALAYSLLKQSQRLDEAKVYITKAHQLDPENPAIMDTLGWLECQLGNYPLAIQLLQKALSLRPDGEIAAHLGEALWRAGETEKAKAIWRRALKQAPHNPSLQETLKRLKLPPQAL